MTAAEQERIYIEFRPKVLSYISSRVNNPDDAEDLCEDVFLKAFRAADTFDEKKASPGTWIYAITRNTVIDFFRKDRSYEEIPEDIRDDALPEDEILKKELLEELATALESLSADLTDIIVMHYYDRLTLTDIASRTGLSYGAVKLRHQKAITLLKKAMEGGSGKVLKLV